jgi:hypothetical protein
VCETKQVILGPNHLPERNNSQSKAAHSFALLKMTGNSATDKKNCGGRPRVASKHHAPDNGAEQVFPSILCGVTDRARIQRHPSDVFQRGIKVGDEFVYFGLAQDGRPPEQGLSKP